MSAIANPLLGQRAFVTSPSSSLIGNFRPSPFGLFNRTRLEPDQEAFQNFAQGQLFDRERALTQQQQGLAGQQLGAGNRAGGINTLFGFRPGASTGDVTNQLGALLGLLGGGGSSGFAGGSFGGPTDADFSQLQNQVGGLLGQVGESRRGDINRSFGNTVNSSLARLQDRGLASSNLTSGVALEGERGRQQELTRLEDALLGQRAGALQNIGLAGLNARQRQGEFAANLSQQQRGQGFALLQSLLG